MWFKKKKEVKKEINGITFEEWVKDHISDSRYLRLYTGKDGTFKRLETFGSVKDISYGIVEKYRNSFVNVTEIVDKDNKPDTTLIFIEK